MDEGQDEYDQFLDVSSGLAKRRKNGEDISADIERITAWRDRAFPDRDDSIVVLDVLRSFNDHEEERDRSKSSLDNSRSSPRPDVQTPPQVVVHVPPCDRLHIPDMVYLAVFYGTFGILLYLIFTCNRQVYT